MAQKSHVLFLGKCWTEYQLKLFSEWCHNKSNIHWFKPKNHCKRHGKQTSNQTTWSTHTHTHTHTSYPPSRSVLSLCWFMLITLSLCPSCLAKYCTDDVFPVPVSPTNKTGSLLLTQTATSSSKLTDWRVNANLGISDLNVLWKTNHKTIT